MRYGRWAAAVSLGAVLCGAAVPAYADHTPRLTSALVSAEAHRGRGARAALDELLRERDVQLYAVFVTSTGGVSGPAFAEAVARENGLGGNDAVLVVSPTEQRYGMWVSRSLPGVTSSEVSSMLSRRVEPELRSGDYDGAVAAAADGLGDAAASSGSGASRGAGTAGPGRLLLILLVLGGVVFAIRAVRRRSYARATEAERAQRHEQLAGEAAAALIRVDERLRDAEAEVRLAGLTSDDADVPSVYENIAGAREHVRVAFETRGREEDEGPDEDLLRQVLASCAAADELLDAVTARTAELRDLQARAPEMLASLSSRIDEVEASVAVSEGELESLRERVPESALTVEGNPAEARKRLDYARSEVAAGLAAGVDVPKAARHARAAEQSVARAEQLVAAVTHLRQAVADAQVTLPNALRSAEQAVSAARVADAEDPRLARAAAAGRLARATGDVVVAVRLAGEAAALAQPVSGDVEARRDTLEAVLAAARAAFTSAYDFIAARREGIGERPRARLLQAERELQLAESLRDSDPDEAVEAARRAEELAYQAYELAADDFDRLDRYSTPYGGGFGGFGMGLPLPLPIPILIGGGGGWGGSWGGGWDGGWGGGDSFGGDFGGGDSFGGTF